MKYPIIFFCCTQILALAYFDVMGVHNFGLEASLAVVNALLINLADDLRSKK